MSAPTAQDVLFLPDAASVALAARAFAPAGRRAVEAVAAAERSWRALAADGVYDTPDTARALAALDGPRRVADAVQTQSTQVATVLEDYAANLQTLSALRADLLAALAAQQADEQRVEVNTAAGTQQRIAQQEAADGALRLQVAAFNDAARKADADCAAALRSIQAFPASGFTAFVGAVEAGNAGKTDLLAEGLGRVRRVPVVSLVPSADEEDLLKALPFDRVPQIEFDGERYVPDPLDPSVLKPAASLSALDRAGIWFAGAESDAEEFALPAAKYGGEAIGFAGFGLTLLAIGLERDQQLQVARPDMTVGQRLAEDVQTTLLVGTPTVIGAYIGSWAVPVLLTAVGGVGGEVVDPAGGGIPGAGLGMLVGAVAGGVLGGAGGEWLGRTLDQQREDEVDDAVHDPAPGYARPDPVPRPTPGPSPVPAR